MRNDMPLPPFPSEGKEVPPEAIPLLEFVAAYLAAEKLGMAQERAALEGYIKQRVRELVQKLSHSQG